MKLIKKLKFTLIIVLCLSIFLNTSVALALNQNINFIKLSTEDGLSQSCINDILQDKDGYIWFATEDGLNRYDGHKFKVYKYKQGVSSLKSSIIAAIDEDKDGNILVGTSKGFDVINKKNGKIENHTYDIKNPKDSLSHYNVWDILIDSKNRTWIGTENGLNLYDKDKNVFQKIQYRKNGDSSDFVTTLEEDELGNIWIGTKLGLFKYNHDTKEYNEICFKDTNKNEIYITKICSDKSGYIWVGTNNYGLSKINIKDNDLITFKYETNNKTSIPSDCIRTLLRDSNGAIWLGTNKGLSKYVGKNKFRNYTKSTRCEYSLSNNDVTALLEDRSGMIWVGTKNGINKFNSKSLFNYYEKYTEESSCIEKFNKFSDKMMQGIYEDSEGILWLGTNNGGINSLDRKNNIIKAYKNEKSKNSLSNNQVWMVTGQEENIWIATSNGLNKLNKKTNTFKAYFHNDKNSLICNEVKSLLIDNEGILWVGTRDGLCTLDKNENFKNYNFIFNEIGVTEKFITSIYQDKDGIMWFGCGIDGGIIKYDKKTGTVKNYRHDGHNKKSLSFNSIKCINEDLLGNIWIATNCGINKFNKQNETFKVYTENDGLSNNFVYGLLIDKKGNIWASTNSGISTIDVETDKINSFNETDGLQSNEFNAYSFFKNKKGEMFFGGINGINSFYPEKLEINKYMPKIVLEKFSVFKSSINLQHKDVKLKYNQNNFFIEYFLPDYRNNKRIKYFYKLEGIDKQWNYSENRNFANYVNVEPGIYNFKVKALNSNGMWSDETKLKIEIKNPFLKTPIAYSIYFIIIILVITFVFNRVYFLGELVKQRTEELEKKYKENNELYKKLMENEKYKNNYFINLSHELRTPLNVLLSSIQLINTLNKKDNVIEKDKLSHYMNIMTGNSKRLLRLINNIIDTSKIDSGSYRLDTKQVDIVYLVEETALSMKDFIESNGLEFIIDPEVEEKIVECDSNEIERCIINLIGNAVKFTKSGGKIEVIIKDKVSEVEISVKDTGIGIEDKFKEAIFDRFGQAYDAVSEEYGGSGLGLTLVNQLIKLHNGEIKLKSEVGVGSEFVIVLPVKQPK